MVRNINIHISSSIYCSACGAENPLQAIHCCACNERLSSLVKGSRAITRPLIGLLFPGVILQRRYRILETLNSSEIITLYKAEDIQLGNRVMVLKEIRKNAQSTSATLELVEAAKREMFHLAGLIHPNLPRIYDYFVENHCWYFVMDFLAGETLEDHLQKSNRRSHPTEEVLDIGIQLATVLDYLHLHQSLLGLRDLTLSSIWRTPDGKLYLLDTGKLPPPTAVPQTKSIRNLGKILRRLQARRFHWYLVPARTERPQLEDLLRRMTHPDKRKQLSTMGMVRQELQQLVTQLRPSKKRRLNRRTLLKSLGFTALTVTIGGIVWQAGSRLLIVPHPGYSPHLGGTICTYNTGSGVLAIAWSPDGTRLVMGDVKAQVQAWDANTGLHTLTFQAPDLSRRIEAIIWLPDGRTVAAAGDDNVVWLWNATTGDLQHTYRGHNGWVITLACSPDGRYIASGSEDTTIQVWEATTGRQVVIYRGHSGGIGSVTWSPDSKYIASGSFDETVQIWEAATGRPIYTYTRQGNSGYTPQSPNAGSGFYTVAWSPDGQRIAAGSADGTVQVWPVTLFESAGQAQNSSIITYTQQQDNNGGSNAVQAVAWSPDSRYLASVSHDVRIWNSFTGEHIFTYLGHTSTYGSAVQAVVWSPNGRYIASGGFEGTVQVWNAWDEQIRSTGQASWPATR